MRSAKKVLRSRGILAFTVCGTIAAGIPFAEAAVDEMLVTAQKREQALSDVPLAVSAFSGDQLNQRNYLTLEDFRGAIPGMTVNNYIGQARVNIRGIGNNSLSFGADTQVAFSINGVFMGRAAQAAQAFLDVDRIEVVRGPQGTLYGRNATGGAVNVITKRPTDEFEASARLSYGNYDAIGSRFVLSGPIAGNTVLGRLAIATEDHDGYSYNLFDDRHYDDLRTRTARATLLFNLSDNVEFVLTGDYHRENDGNYAAHFLGLSPGFPLLTGQVLGGSTIPVDSSGRAVDPRLLNVNNSPLNDHEVAGVDGTLTWDLNEDLTLKSITAYRHKKLDLRPPQYDATEASFPSGIQNFDFFGEENASQFSQEIQFLGDLDRFDWVLGLYYFHEKIDPGFFWIGLNFGAINFPFVTPFGLGGVGETDAYAAFGEATVDITERLSFTAGLRYSYEKRSAEIRQIIPAFFSDITIPDSESFDDLSPRFSLSYDWTDEIMTYVTVSKGFKSGGYDLSAPPPVVPFDQETVWSYEGGIKLQKDWISADLSVFHYDYKNLQVFQIINNLPATRNAATSKIDGVEVAATVEPVNGLTITGAFSHLNARYTEFETINELSGMVEDLSGNKLVHAPKFQSNLAIDYTVPVGEHELSFFGEWNWHERIYHTEFNSILTSQSATSTYNAAIRFAHGGGRWSAELFGRNLSDELVVSTSWISSVSFGAPIHGQLRPPRTYGIVLNYSFN